MRQNIFLLLFFTLLFLTTPVVFAQVSQNDIDKAIDKKILIHPYLYFSEDDKPSMLERIKNDSESNDIMARLLAESNRFLFTPVEKQMPIQQKHPRYWTDGKATRYVGQNRRAALTLAFVYQMTGNEKYALKAFEFADALCDLQSWVYRAHEFPINDDSGNMILSFKHNGNFYSYTFEETGDGLILSK